MHAPPPGIGVEALTAVSPSLLRVLCPHRYPLALFVAEPELLDGGGFSGALVRGFHGCPRAAPARAGATRATSPARGAQLGVRVLECDERRPAVRYPRCSF
jgi:hypothetical protein